MRVLIIDYKMGNLHSVARKLQLLKTDPIISSKAEEVQSADKIILPGVGHFGKAMKNLQDLNLIDVLNKKVLSDKVPILGICLGMQLMMKHSDEGDTNGLGWFDANVVRFKVKDSLRYKIPHTGWNQSEQQKDSFLLQGLDANPSFYFVHSFHVDTKAENDVLQRTQYEYEFVSSMERENIFGVQYHPEKSHQDGLKLLQNFIEL